MISSWHLQKAMGHYYETHEPRFMGGYKFTYLTCAYGSDFPGLIGISAGLRGSPLTITDVRFKWYIRLWLRIKSLSRRREQQAGLKDWRPIEIRQKRRLMSPIRDTSPLKASYKEHNE